MYSNSTVLQVRKSVTREFKKNPVQMINMRKRKNKYFTLGVNQSTLFLCQKKNVLGAGMNPPLTIMKRLFRKQKKHTGRHPEEQTL